MKKQVNGKKVGMSAPWDGHMSMLASFFRGDDRVRVGYCENGVGTIEVFDAKMYDAIRQVLRQKIRFGNVTLRIDVVLAVDAKLPNAANLTDLAALKVVLSKNPAFSKIKAQKADMFDFVFCIFKPVVLQWYSDNLGSPWKLTTCTYEHMADRVFKTEIGVSFATEPPKGVKFRKAK